MQKTIDVICNAAELPISIIIVGIGDANFSKMERLDGDDGMLYSSKGVKCPRDIVQFVAFKSVSNNKEKLRSQVLAELPRQIEEYYSACKLLPNKPLVADASDFAAKSPEFKLNEVVDPMMSMGLAHGD